MHQLKYIVYRENKYFVAQCLNVEVSSFDTTIDGAINNLREAVELYFEDDSDDIQKNYHEVGEMMLGEMKINV